MKRIVRCNRNLVFFPENTHFGDQFSLDWVPQQASFFHIINLLHWLKGKKRIQCSQYLCKSCDS